MHEPDGDLAHLVRRRLYAGLERSPRALSRSLLEIDHPVDAVAAGHHHLLALLSSLADACFCRIRDVRRSLIAAAGRVVAITCHLYLRLQGELRSFGGPAFDCPLTFACIGLFCFGLGLLRLVLGRTLPCLWSAVLLNWLSSTCGFFMLLVGGLRLISFGQPAFHL